MIYKILFSSALLAILLSSCAKRNEETAVDTTRHATIVPALLHSYPDASLTIVAPREGEVLKAGDSVRIVMQVTGTELGVHTDADSTLGIAYSKMGQHVHVIVDDKPYMADYKNGQPFNVGVLAPGLHTIRAFPSFSWHESIKSPHAFAQKTFFVGSPLLNSPAANNLDGPLLTYSRPKGIYTGAEDSTVLLDFYISNATLGPTDYRVHLWIDSVAMQDIVKWQPYYIMGLSKGKHTVQLQLISPNGTLVPGPFNNPAGTFTLE